MSHATVNAPSALPTPTGVGSGGLVRLISCLIWQSGRVGKIRARRNRISGKVQFVLWRAGEQQHTKDCWYPMHASHWPHFKPNNPAQTPEGRSPGGCL